MNVNQLKQVLPVLTKHSIVPLIWGVQGIGKTQVVTQAASENGFGIVKLNLATQEVGDLVGLLRHNDDGTVTHACPEWMPTVEAVASGRFPQRGYIFLDEINRAHPDVVQAMFPFITGKTMHTHRLADGWAIVTAANYQTDEFTVTDTSDSAWMSRFCHLNFEPTSAEFVAYAEKREAFSVADFIAEHSELLEAKGRKRPDLNITPDRRAWLEMIAPLENEALDEGTRMEIYSGIVGMTAASRFITFKTTKERRLRLRDILRNYEEVKERVKSLNKNKDTRYDALAAPIQELEAKVEGGIGLEPEEVDNLKKYFLDIPKELLAQTTKKLGRANFKGKNELLNDPIFAKRFFK